MYKNNFSFFYDEIMNLVPYKEYVNLTYSKIIEVLQKQDKVSIIDLGCGTGNFIEELESKLIKEKIYEDVAVLGMDVSNDMLEVARIKNIKNVIQKDINDIDESIGRFDIACLYFDTFEYLSNKEFINLIYK